MSREIYDLTEAYIAVGEANDAMLEWVVSCLEDSGYEVRDLERGDTYFMHRTFPNSRNSFRLSRVWPGWRFGLWIDGEALLEDGFEPDTPVLQLFCQHETAIDKFKPHSSDLCVTVDRQDLERMLDGPECAGSVPTPLPYRKIMELVESVRLHPFLSFAGVSDWRLQGHPMLDTTLYIANERFWQHFDQTQCEFWHRWAERKAREARRLPFVGETRLFQLGCDEHPELVLHVGLHDDPTDNEVRRMRSIFPRSLYGMRGTRDRMLHVTVWAYVDGRYTTFELE